MSRREYYDISAARAKRIAEDLAAAQMPTYREIIEIMGNHDVYRPSGRISKLMQALKNEGYDGMAYWIGTVCAEEAAARNAELFEIRAAFSRLVESDPDV